MLPVRQCSEPAVKNQTEIELKFLVPRAARARILAEMSRGATPLERISLAATYLDTDDRRLARVGLAWRLRREGRHWIQTLKGPGANPLERFEHEVMRPDATHDAMQHADTAAGRQLIAILDEARVDGVELEARFRTNVRRSVRRIRTRGAVVDIAFDEGRLSAADSTQRILEIEFELNSGSTAALLALAERWRKRFGLIYDPRSKSERGDLLAQGVAYAPLRKAIQPRYSRRASAHEAFGVVVDECLGQITRCAIGVVDGDSNLRVEHVHQLRVGIRRLRSALRGFRAWVKAPPADLVDRLRELFATLGRSRESDVLGSGVAVELAKVGAPPLNLPTDVTAPDPADVIKAGETQKTLLDWIAWRAKLAEEADVEYRAMASVQDPTAVDDSHTPSTKKLRARRDTPGFHRSAERRLRRWHERIVADWKVFDELDEAGLHVLRKQIKRQRYAVEFFASALRTRQAGRYLNALGTIQNRMGELNDLFVARTQYQGLVQSDPAAWFALGWLAARIAEVRALAKRELGVLSKVDPPSR